MKQIECFLGKKIEETDKKNGNNQCYINYGNAIFCEFQSISYREFYQAQSTGFKPEMNLKISIWDYNDEQYVKYENVEYTILKVYVIKNNPDEILLTLVKGIK